MLPDRAIRFHSFLAALAGIISFVSPSGARTFYVDHGNPEARDFLTSGSENVPFKTLGAACRKAGAGDTVMVKPGIYREILTPMKSGRENAPLVFQATGPGVWVKGSDVITGWKKEGNRWVIRPWRPRLFYDSNLMDGMGNAPFHSSARMEQVFVAGKPLQWTPNSASLKEGGFYWAANGSEIILSLASGLNPNKVLTEIPVRGATVAAWPTTDIPRSVNEAERNGTPLKKLGLPQIDWVVIRGFRFAHNAATINRSGVRIQGRFWLLENNTVEWMNTNGIGVDNDATLRGNLTRFNGQSGVGGTPRGAVLDGNTSFFDNIRDFSTSWGGGGLKFARTEGMTVRNQVVMGAGGAGIWFDIDCLGTLLEKCVVLPNRMGACGASQGAIFYEVSYNAAIANNVLFGNHWGIDSKDAYGGGVTISDSTGVAVSGNTVIFCDNGFSVLGAARGLGAKMPGPFWKAFGVDAYYAREVGIQNNLVVGDLTKAFGIVGKNTVEAASGNVISGNHFAASNSGAAVYCDATTGTLDSMQKAYPQVFSDNMEPASLAALSAQEKAELDTAAGRILRAVARIEPEIQKERAEVLAIWRFPGSVSQGLFVSAGDENLCIVDNPQPGTLRFVCPANSHPKAWISAGDYWVSLKSVKGGHALDAPAGLCVVTGLSARSTIGR